MEVIFRRFYNMQMPWWILERVVVFDVDCKNVITIVKVDIKKKKKKKKNCKFIVSKTCKLFTQAEKFFL